jgi:hypothetical protein
MDGRTDRWSFGWFIQSPNYVTELPSQLEQQSPEEHKGWQAAVTSMIVAFTSPVDNVTYHPQIVQKYSSSESHVNDEYSC